MLKIICTMQGQLPEGTFGSGRQGDLPPGTFH